MKDKFKELLQGLPEVEPKESVEKTLWQIVRAEMLRLRERRLSVLLGIISAVFVFLTLKQLIYVAKILDTTGFFALLGSDSSWLLNESLVVLAAFRETSPLKEMVFLLFLLVFLGFSLYGFIQSREIEAKKEKKMKKGLAVLIILLFLAVAGWFLVFKNEADNKMEWVNTADETKTDRSVSATPLPAQKTFFLKVNSPANGITVKTDKVTMAGKTSLGAEVFINEIQVYPDKNGNFSVVMPLEEGENYFLIGAGNENGDGEAERTVYYELQ